MAPKWMSELAHNTLQSRFHDSSSDKSANNSNDLYGSGSSSGLEVQRTMDVSRHSPHTTRSKATVEAKTTPSQSEEEAASSRNEKGADEEKFGDNASAWGSDEE